MTKIETLIESAKTNKALILKRAGIVLGVAVSSVLIVAVAKEFQAQKENAKYESVVADALNVVTSENI